MWEDGEVKKVKIGETAISMILIPEEKDTRKLEFTTGNETYQRIFISPLEQGILEKECSLTKHIVYPEP